MAMGSAITSFALDVDELGWTGQDLQRPESVVAEPDGTLWASDAAAGSPASTLTAHRRCWAAGVGSPTGWPSIPAATWSPPTSPWGGSSG
jgi:hypothetical protein